MHSPIVLVFALFVIATCITVLVTKRPHNSWLKIAFIVCMAALFARSVYGFAQIHIGVAVGAVVVMAAILMWRTFQGWATWWEKL
jgi:hypothetical protein